MMRQSCLRTARRLARVHTSSLSISPTVLLSLTSSSNVLDGTENEEWRSKRFFSKRREERDYPLESLDEDDFFISDSDLSSSFRPEDMEFYDREDLFASEEGVEKEEESEEDLEEKEAKEMEARDEIQRELDSRTGRLWQDPYEIKDEDYGSALTLDELPSWSTELCSRVSKERVKVHPSGVPTLDEIAKLNLPSSPPPHPALGDSKPYLKHRKKTIDDIIYKGVSHLMRPHMERILNIDDEKWDEKQDAIDDLYEMVLEKITTVDPKAFGVYEDNDDQMSVVLARMPGFANRVEAAIERYLKDVVQKEKDAFDGKDSPKEEAKPIFMDLLKAQKNSDLDDEGVPKLVYPLTNHKNHNSGRMVEEWQLAANQDTRRIMIRESTKQIAAAMTENDSGKILVKGPKGAGKTAVLASIVASARESGHIVLYLPDGNRLTRHGFYSELNSHRSKDRDTKLFDLPLLSKEACTQLLYSHEDDLEGIEASTELLKDVFTGDQLRILFELKKEEDIDVTNQPLAHLLKVGSENVALSSGCYSAVVETLLNHQEKTFTVVMDEFNCYYERGHYFNADYDSKVKHPIPMNQISLVQPFLDAFGVERKQYGPFVTKVPNAINKSYILMGLTESRAVGRSVTDGLANAASLTECSTVIVPQYTALEVKHVLSNFEIIGIGRLRFDRGATVMSNQEVNYLRMVSGAHGQLLLDACLT